MSYRDVEGLLAERGVTVDHCAVYRWVHVSREFIEPLACEGHTHDLRPDVAIGQCSVEEGCAIAPVAALGGVITSISSKLATPLITIGKLLTTA